MESLIQSLSMWSYLLLFVLVFLECAGLPLPGYSIALVAAALAGQGQLAFWAVFGVTAVGSILGGMVGYWIGSRGGRGLIESYGRYVLITPPRFSQAEKLFHKHGSKAVLLGRYFPLLCFMAGILSGIARLPYRRFLVYNIIGTLLWCSSHLSLGYVFGRSLEALNQAFNNGFMALAVALVIVGIVAIVRRKIQARRKLRQPVQLPLDDSFEG